MAQGRLRMSRALRFSPFILLALLLAGLMWRLANPGDTTVSSKMVGRQLPDASLAPLLFNGSPIPLQSLIGKPMVINFFASWCVPCVAEAPQLAELKRRGARIVGVAVRDRPDDVANFLTNHGNPYAVAGADPESQVQIALGSSGVPESFIVDGRGVIRYQHIGPIEASDVPMIMAKLEQAR